MSELDFIDIRLYLPRREEAVLSNLSPEAHKELSAITLNQSYTSGSQLIVCDQAPVGIFVICSGRVNFLICPSQGKPFRFAKAEPGELLGLTPHLQASLTVLALRRREGRRSDSCLDCSFLSSWQSMEN